MGGLGWKGGGVRCGMFVRGGRGVETGAGN